MSYPLATIGVFLVIWVIWKTYYRLCLQLSPLDNIDGPPTDSFIAGNFHQFFSDNAREYLIELLKTYGGVTKLKFYFGETRLLVSDPLALYSIVIKDQHIYEPSPSQLLPVRLFFGPGLVATIGEQHRKQRKVMNPVFSIAHLRGMMPVFYDVVGQLRDSIANKVKEGPQEIEVLGWTSRAALELIGQSGFGYSFDGLKEDSVPHPFAARVKRFDAVLKRLFFGIAYLVPIFSKIGTHKFQSFVARRLPWKAMQLAVELIDTMHNTSVDIIKSRKRAIEAGKETMDKQIGRGKDIISVLLQANERAETCDKLSDEEITAQVSVFTLAAMDTTSSALSRTLWILSHHQDAQEKLRREIRDAKENRGDLTYDELSNLPYLDAVCRETLRMYPPVTSLRRTAGQDAVLPLGTPIKGKDGAEMHEIHIPKGTLIQINIPGCNNDPAIWGQDSFEWKPERWLQPLPESVLSARIPGVFSNLMTFLGGGRGCIGFKFSQLEMKMVLLQLIDSFKFSPVPGKEIHWRSQGIARPAVVGFDALQLPLVVERAK